MDATDRLAAYLAGELTAAERHALEAELARDDALRARLTAMQRADTALARVAAPDPPAGFDERLHRAVDIELARLLDTSSTPSRGPATGRLRHDRPERPPRATVTPLRGWAPALAGVAAAVAAVAGIGLAVTNLAPADDVMMMAGDVERADDPVAERSAPDAALAPPGILGAVDSPGPLIVDVGRSIDDHDLILLLEQPDLANLAWQLHEDIDVASTAERWTAILRAEIAASLHDAEGESAPATAPDAGPADGAVLEPGPLRVTTSSPSAMAIDDLTAIDRCLRELPAEPAIPVYIELATNGADRDVIVVGLALVATGVSGGDGPATGLREVRVLDRATCTSLTQVSA